MIPKILHFCWFGGKDYPDDIKSCMDTWRDILGDYELMRWVEDNFDIHRNKYVEQAYEKEKWAFVSDYVRLWALYEYGGIYCDCDVRVLKPLDPFLSHAFFSGYENKARPQDIQTGMIGAEKGHPFIKHLLDDYYERTFIKPDRSLDLTTNVERFTEIAKELYGFVGDGTYRTFGEDIHIYPYDYFSGFTGDSGIYGDKSCYNVTQNTYTIHEFAGSWLRQEIKKSKWTEIKNSIIAHIKRSIEKTS